MVRVGILLSVMMLVAIGGVGSPLHTDYAQVSCEVDKDSRYAVIWVDEASKIGQHPPLKYNVQFDPAGVTWRMPPEYFAPDWTQVEDIEMRYHDNTSQSGILVLRMHDTDGSRYSDTVGSVKRSCWAAVRNYVLKHVDRKGLTVRISETMEK